MKLPLIRVKKTATRPNAKPKPTAKPSPASPYTEEEARKVMERLRGMGYVWHI